MNAIKFIQQHGVEKAREAITQVAWCETAYCTMLKHGCFKTNSDCCVDIKELKRLVESVDLVTAWGGLESAYSKFRYAQEYKNTYAANMIQQAIADYESIYCVADMGDDTHIENHVSPNCKVGVK